MQIPTVIKRLFLIIKFIFKAEIEFLKQNIDRTVK